MAGFRTHITVSTALGIGYGTAAVAPGGFTPSTGLLAAAVTGVGGMLPDLDSDSGVPVREISGLAAAAIPILLGPRLATLTDSQEARLAIMVLLYLGIRYGLARLIRRSSVHRGMFHSIPAMLIAGMIVYLEYTSPDLRIRLLLAGGVMLGFFSHLLLDELYSIDFHGVRLRLNRYAGSAIKMVSPSWVGTSICYGLLAGFGVLTYLDALQYLPREW